MSYMKNKIRQYLSNLIGKIRHSIKLAKMKKDYESIVKNKEPITEDGNRMMCYMKIGMSVRQFWRIL